MNEYMETHKEEITAKLKKMIGGEN